jgi:hypothetical protein
MMLTLQPSPVIARSAQRDEAISAPRWRLQVTRDCFASLAMTLDGIISYKETETQQ